MLSAYRAYYQNSSRVFCQNSSNFVKIWRRFFASDENLSYWHETSSIPLIYETTGISFRKATEKFPDKEFFSFPYQNIRKTYAETFQEVKKNKKFFFNLKKFILILI